MDNDTLDRAWLDIPLSRIEADVEKLTDLLIRSGLHDSRSQVGDTLILIKGQLEQMREGDSKTGASA